MPASASAPVITPSSFGSEGGRPCDVSAAASGTAAADETGAGAAAALDGRFAASSVVTGSRAGCGCDARRFRANARRTPLAAAARPAEPRYFPSPPASRKIGAALFFSGAMLVRGGQFGVSVCERPWRDALRLRRHRLCGGRGIRRGGLRSAARLPGADTSNGVWSHARCDSTNGCPRGFRPSERSGNRRRGLRRVTSVAREAPARTLAKMADTNFAVRLDMCKLR